jgi:hypothetical protein
VQGKAEAEARILQLQREVAAAGEALASSEAAAFSAASSGEKEVFLSSQHATSSPLSVSDSFSADNPSSRSVMFAAQESGYFSKTSSNVFTSLLSKIKSDSSFTADTQIVHLERDDKGFGLIMDQNHFDNMGIKLHESRENSPAAISGMVESGHRLVMVDDLDVTDLNAEQVLELLKTKTSTKLCLKTQAAAKAYFDSKGSASHKSSSASQLSTDVHASSSPAVSKAASMFVKLKSASSFFTSNIPTTSATSLPATDPESNARKALVSLSIVFFFAFVPIMCCLISELACRSCSENMSAPVYLELEFPTFHLALQITSDLLSCCLQKP